MNHFKSYLVLFLSFVAISCSSTQKSKLFEIEKPAAALAPAKAIKNQKPDHLVVMLFDSMRPDFIDRFQLKNFQKLRANSKHFKNAIVGYVGAETVVSHLVIPTGLKPKDLPWQDDVFFDREGKIGEKGEFYSSGSLTGDQQTQLMNTLPKKNFLAPRLKEKFGGKIFSIAQKPYAAYAFGTPYADSVITLKKENGKCFVQGHDVPSYLLENKRFELQCSEKYGTEKTYYPLDGNRFVPGHDPEHLGGDVWVADAAVEIMKHENWSGLFLSFGGIDKLSHMLAEHEGPSLAEKVNGTKTEYSLEQIAKTADEQLGKIIKTLEEQNLLARTVIVITADHGGQANAHYLGNGKTAKWGSIKNESAKDAEEQPSDTVKSYSLPEHVRFTLQDSAIRIWLKDSAKKQFKPVVEKLKMIEGVSAIYHLVPKLNGPWYKRIYKNWNNTEKPFRDWAKLHDEKLVNAAASKSAPDLFVLLKDGYGFDLLGDHGGAQEKVQRIPLMIQTPGEKPEIVNHETHLYDVKTQIERALKL